MSTLTELKALRQALDQAFAADTAVPGEEWRGGSHGHCAAVAAIVHVSLGGGLASSKVDGVSHWFNELQIGPNLMHVDITGDQFGFEPIGVAPKLYEGTRVRSFGELNDETLRRAGLLARRAKLEEVSDALYSEIRRRGTSN